MLNYKIDILNQHKTFVTKVIFLGIQTTSKKGFSEFR